MRPASRLAALQLAARREPGPAEEPEPPRKLPPVRHPEPPPSWPAVATSSFRSCRSPIGTPLPAMAPRGCRPESSYPACLSPPGLTEYLRGVFYVHYAANRSPDRWRLV